MFLHVGFNSYFFVQVFKDWKLEDFVSTLPPPVQSIQKKTIPMFYVYTETENKLKLRQESKKLMKKEDEEIIVDNEEDDISVTD